MTQNRTDLGKVVGANLRRLIKGSAYRTQAEFAYAFGVDERTVRRWVSSGIEKVYIIDEIADFFKIDRMNLLSEREEVSPFSMATLLRKFQTSVAMIAHKIPRVPMK